MNYKNSILALLIIFCITSCVFVPVISRKQPYTTHCDMVIKKLSLKSAIADEFRDHHDQLEFMIVLGLASAVVSGSIVLIGNTLHWSEYKIKCKN